MAIAMQIDHDMADRMIETAIAFCAGKTFACDTERTLHALHDGQCNVCDYLCYSLAEQVGEYMGQIDQTIKAVYVFEPEYATAGEEALTSRTMGINLIVWVSRKSAALNALVAALNALLAEGWREKIGCIKAKPACYILDVQMADDADVHERRGYGAILGSLHMCPIRVWSRAA